MSKNFIYIIIIFFGSKYISELSCVSGNWSYLNYATLYFVLFTLLDITHTFLFIKENKQEGIKRAVIFALLFSLLYIGFHFLLQQPTLSDFNNQQITPVIIIIASVFLANAISAKVLTKIKLS